MPTPNASTCHIASPGGLAGFSPHHLSPLITFQEANFLQPISISSRDSRQL